MMNREDYFQAGHDIALAFLDGVGFGATATADMNGPESERYSWSQNIDASNWANTFATYYTIVQNDLGNEPMNVGDAFDLYIQAKQWEGTVIANGHLIPACEANG